MQRPGDGGLKQNEVINIRDYRDDDDHTVPQEAATLDELPSGTRLLHGQYTITAYLNSGGFGITYKAEDSLGRPVVIKECFPGMMCRRQGNAVVPRATYGEELAKMIKQFVQEAHSLAALSHKNIVHVHQVFEENGTAYMAIDFINGLDLLEIIETYPERLTPSEIVRLTKRTLNAIRCVHENGMLHRDISPDNILIDERGEPILIDFGAARRNTKTSKRAFSQMKFVKDGYSPQEFYVEGAQQGPWSDLYSFGASIYHAISGEAPVDGQRRLSALAQKQPDPYTQLSGRIEGYPKGFLEAIDAALVIVPQKRLQTTDEWIARLKSQPVRPRSERPQTSIGAPVDTSTTPEQAVAKALAEVEKTLPPEVDTPAAKVTPKRAPAPTPHQAPANPNPAPTVVAEAAKPAVAPEKESRGKGGLFVGVAILALVAGGAFYGYQNVMQTEGADEAAAIETAPATVNAPSPEETVAIAPSNNTPVVAEIIEDELVTFDVPDITAKAPLASPRPLARPVVEPVRTEPLEFRTSDEIANGLMALRPVPEPDPADLLPNIAPTITVQGAAAEGFVFTAEQTGEPVTFAAQTTDITTLHGILMPMAPSSEATAIVDASAPAPLPKPEPVVARISTPPTAVTEPMPSETTPVLPMERMTSHWDVQMPFSSTLVQARNAHTVVIDSVDPAADLATSGEWIAAGVTLFSFNEEKLQPNTPLSVHFLNTLSIDPDGFARATVHFRPDGGAIQRGLLAVPVSREIALADGTRFSARVVGGVWTVAVVETGSNDLLAGDVLMTEIKTGTDIDGHDALAQAFDVLAENQTATATFLVQRDEELVSVDVPVPAIKGDQP